MPDTTIHTLVPSTNRGRYALDDPNGPDLTSGDDLTIRLGKHWIAGHIEAGRRYASEHTGQTERGYYFIAVDGNVCGLCTGMQVRIP